MGERVRGHSLVNEGAPFAFNESGGINRVGTGVGIGGYGRGLCSCGAHSELLDSAYQRKQWHRAHKEEMRNPAEIRKGEEGPYLPGHREVTYDLGTPRNHTERGGWNVRCECGVVFAETGDKDFNKRWMKHLKEVAAHV